PRPTSTRSTIPTSPPPRTCQLRHRPREMRRRAAPVTVGRMRRVRFYLTLLALTLLPQGLAAVDLVGWLQARGVTWLSLSVPGVLLLLNAPMAFEVLRRKRKTRLPRALTAALQTPWT